MGKKKLGFGFMRLPLTDSADSGSVDQAAVCKMVDKFMDAGFTYYDTAAPYHNRGNSEIALRECVVKHYPRDAFTITNKLSLFMIDKKEDIPAFFDAQLERCGVEYFDYYLLHAMAKEPYAKAESFGAFEFAAQKKAEGKIKHIGFSFHDTADFLDKILTEHPEVEYVQLQLNYIDWEDEKVQSRKCYEVCVKHNKPVIVMEPVKGGVLANVTDDVKEMLNSADPSMSTTSWAIRFAASLDNVAMVLSGMSNDAQAEDNISYMRDFKPLNDDEVKLVLKAAEIIKSKEKIACTACRYCVDDCPKKIAIPDYFKLINDISKHGKGQEPIAKASYARQTQKFGKASDCIKCGKCEGHCPQNLPVRKYLEDVAAVFEG
ncbi:MAG: aldo/keto reductase [Firmicutes bacterium]|nr:aldo/keto reductase [Bacillota bacterium]